MLRRALIHGKSPTGRRGQAKIAGYALIGLLGLAAGLIAFLPAQIAADWVAANTKLRLGGVTGTLLFGKAAYVAGPNGAADHLSWTWHPLALLRGQITAAIHIDSDRDGFSATVTHTLFGNIQVDDLTGSASAGWLARLDGVIFSPLSGRVGVDIKRVAFTDQMQVSALRGRIRLVHTRWQLVKPPLKLGRFTIALSHSGHGIKAVIIDSHGPLAMAGGITVANAGRYHLDLRLRAHAGASPRLEHRLKQFGPADAQGWHRIHGRGRF